MLHCVDCVSVVINTEQNRLLRNTLRKERKKEKNCQVFQPAVVVHHIVAFNTRLTSPLGDRLIFKHLQVTLNSSDHKTLLILDFQGQLFFLL